MPRALMHPRMWQSLESYWQHRCTIYARAASQDDDGQPHYTWTAVTNMSNIPCILTPMPGMANESEIRRLMQTATVKEKSCWLRGLFDTVDETYRASVDGEMFEIIGVDVESQRTMTRLRLERIS